MDISGIWRMVEERATDPAGNRVAARFGPEGAGLVQIWQTAPGQGRMMAVLVDNRAEIPAGAAREYNSYCGAWRLEGSILTTRVDAALPPLMGTDQVRQVKWEGARLVLSPPPLQRGGQAISRELVWERVAP